MDDVTLSPEMYAVLERVPESWTDVRSVEVQIAQTIGKSLGVVRRHLTHLRTLKLVDYRLRQTIRPAFQVRRLVK